jgi:FkbM family methyltransferase
VIGGAGPRLRALKRPLPQPITGVRPMASVSPDLHESPAATDEACERFLALVAQARETQLADNLDHLFHPWGHELPDPAGEQERVAEQLAILARCGTIWERMDDERSRDLLLRFLAYRALGPAHVRLELEPLPYRRSVTALTAQMAEKVGLLGVPGMPFEWQFHLYNLAQAGYPLRIVGQPLPLASTFLFSQYAYRDEHVPARPRPGDVAVDAGGCWGETALWLAHMVGAEGRVHTFEPAPRNRDLLARNLSLNPLHANRVTVWEHVLGARRGETAWIANRMAAGVTVRDELAKVHSWDQSEHALELRTETIDALVAQGAIERVDFLKVDVEGADVGVLEGAAETIRAFRPRLAIACYHKPDDLVQIPEAIASLGVEYRWHLQCSTMVEIDTVAFAVPVEPA